MGLMAFAESYASQNIPAAYGVVLTLGNSGSPDGSYWLFQLAFGTDGKLHHRSSINNPGVWDEWITFG